MCSITHSTVTDAFHTTIAECLDTHGKLPLSRSLFLDRASVDEFFAFLCFENNLTVRA